LDYRQYVDSFALLGIGLSGLAILTRFLYLSPLADWGIVSLAIIGSMINTFIKPVVYAEVGFKQRIGGKIEDPLEGIGFFGRPETILFLIASTAKRMPIASEVTAPGTAIIVM
jgi:archaetidylinositol phosphate synthase